MPAEKPHCKAINTKVSQYLFLGESNQKKSPGEFNKLSRPVFCSCLYNETWWPMLNVHLSYKPPSSYRILFRYGGRPRQFSYLKIFRSLVVPIGRCHKGVIMQWRLMKRRFSCGRPVMLEKKRGCSGSICPCIQTEEYYVHTDVHTVYLQDHMTQTPSLSNPPIRTIPSGTRFLSPVTGAQKKYCTRDIVDYGHNLSNYMFIIIMFLIAYIYCLYKYLLENLHTSKNIFDIVFVGASARPVVLCCALISI